MKNAILPNLLADCLTFCLTFWDRLGRLKAAELLGFLPLCLTSTPFLLYIYKRTGGEGGASLLLRKFAEKRTEVRQTAQTRRNQPFLGAFSGFGGWSCA